jgi:hypothetical protein
MIERVFFISRKLLHLPESSEPILMCMAYCEVISPSDLISQDISDSSGDQQTQTEVLFYLESFGLIGIQLPKKYKENFDVLKLDKLPDEWPSLETSKFSICSFLIGQVISEFGKGLALVVK